MSVSIVLSSPFLLFGYLVALLLTFFELKRHATGLVFPLLAIALFVITTIFALLQKATLMEIAIVTFLFLLANLLVYVGKEVQK